MPSNSIYEKVGGVSPSRSLFDLSYRKKFTADMGQLIPIMCDEMVPGDKFDVSAEVVIRFAPLVAPIMHEVNCFVHYFFVPYRLLWSSWEDFITGGVDGTLTPTLPTWSPTIPAGCAEGSLWDYLGLPTALAGYVGAEPLDFIRSSYNLIYNEYYRDQQLTTAVALTNETILNRAWEKDYFTSALPWQQRGTAPALPIAITGSSSAVWTAATFPLTAAATRSNLSVNNATSPDNTIRGDVGFSAAGQANAINAFNANTVAGSNFTAASFDISTLRLAFQVQKWLERNARSGARYTEFLKAHFNVAPSDSRLQRPEYCGGTKSPVIISEVLNTAGVTGSAPQGTMAGHGITADRQFAGSYKAEEFGLMMGIMSVMPRTAYQQGINRQWLRRTKYDWYFPEFANLSEQPVTRAEIYTEATAPLNATLFGYQGRYNEMRSKQDMVCSAMRSSLAYWHMGRVFGAAPVLNSAFVVSNPKKTIFAVPSAPGLICQVGNVIRAARPMPYEANPGLVDHG